MDEADDLQLGGLEIISGGNIVLTGGGTLQGLPDSPAIDSEAVSKKYATALIYGLDPKESVRLATVSTLPSYTATGSKVGKYLEANIDGALSVDGIAVAVDDRILVKDEAASHVDHGIYTVTATGGVSSKWKLTRATDFDEDAEVTSGAYCWVIEGNTQEGSTWVVLTADDITVDSTAIKWTQQSGPGTYTGGNGINITGTLISVDLNSTNPGLEFVGVGSDKLQVALSGTTLERDASGIKVKGVPLNFEINGVATSSNVTSTNLGTLTDGISSADSLHTHLSVGAERLEDEMVAYENITKGDPVEWGGAANEIQRCRADTADKIDVIGVAIEDIADDSSGTVIRRGVALGVISSATVGDRYYVGDTGGLVNGTGGIGGGKHVVFVGTAKNATDLEVHPSYRYKKN